MSFSNNSNTSQVIKNYILDGNFVNGDVQAYTGYNDGASATPTDGTGGTNTTFVRSLESASPIEGTYSIDFVKSAGNQQGNGISIPFTIDSGDKGKVLRVGFNYKILSGTFADNDVTVYLYDITNSTLIQPAPFQLKNHSLPSDSLVCEFQTSITSTSYRLIFHCASTSTSAYTLTLDNIFVGRLPKTYGSPTTDFVSYTPTFTGYGTVTTSNFKSRKVGDTLEVIGTFTTGTVTATEARISLGFNGVDSNVTSISTLPTVQVVGWAHDNGTASASDFRQRYILAEASKTYITLGSDNSTNTGLTKQNGNATAATGAVFSVFFKVPIQGWSSSQVMSSDADTRVVAASYNLTTNLTINTTVTDIAGLTKVLDTHSAMNSATGVYTFPVAGQYELTTSLRIDTGASAPTQQIITTVGTGLVPSSTLAAASSFAATKAYNYYPSLLFSANAGDTIKIQGQSLTNASTAIAGQNIINIKRLSGPSQIAANETVAARYNSSATSLSTTQATIVYTSKDYDTHSAYSTSTGKFTAPMSGKYRVTGYLYVTASWTAGQAIVSAVRKNGTSIGQDIQRIDTTASAARSFKVVDTVSCVTGDTLEFALSSEGTTPSISASTLQNYIVIERIGN